MTTKYKILWSLKTQISTLPAAGTNYFSFLQHFSDFTVAMITQHKFDIAGRCFKLAEKVFLKGKEPFKSAMSTIFLHALTPKIKQYRCESLLPVVLKNKLQNPESDSIK
jgi:hypothetical protein